MDEDCLEREKGDIAYSNRLPWRKEDIAYEQDISHGMGGKFCGIFWELGMCVSNFNTIFRTGWKETFEGYFGN